MSDAPERIWMDPDIKFPECEKQYGCDVEYVRADRIATLEAQLEKAKAALKHIEHYDIHAPTHARNTLAELEADK